MTILYFEALAAVAVPLSVPMAGAWVAQQRTGNSGWVDRSGPSPAISWTPEQHYGRLRALPPMPAPRFMYWIPLYVTGIPPMLRSRGDRYRDCQSRTSPLFSRCRRST
jgi:steroid 5-alpha reductase family enzyme